MSTNSLIQSYTNTQPNKSWIDDPFELNEAAQGLVPMNHERKLSQYAEELVAYYAKFDGSNYNLILDNLGDNEQNELARLYIEYSNRDLSECIYGDDFTLNGEFTTTLMLMLKNDCLVTRESFAEVTRKNILIYYRQDLQEILDDACNTYHCNMMTNQGYFSSIDNDSGDVVWGNF